MARTRVYKDDSVSQWNQGKGGKFDPRSLKTPGPMVTKIGMGDDVGDPEPCAKFYYDPIRGFAPRPCAPAPAPARASTK